jgi:TonB family protein
MYSGSLARVFFGSFLALVAFAVCAGSPRSVRKQVEASLVATGTIDIAVDGTVAGYALDQPEALPDGVSALASKVIPNWRFKPVRVDGKLVRARAKMNLRYVAKKQDDGKYLMRISSTWFGADKREPGDWVASQTKVVPHYPRDALRAEITGTAFVVLRVDRNGKVADAVVERVNLRVVGSEQQMERGRKLLGQASMAALRQWTFVIPKTGPKADDHYWDVRVPVMFMIAGQKPVAYGQWDAYVPGPVRPVPWIPADQARSSDALADGGVYPVGEGPQLLTGLGSDAG